MSKKLEIEYDSALLDAISSEFDLRAPNKEALRKLVYTLNGEYDPAVMQVMNLATGVGKTYLMAAFMEYLRRQGVGNVVIVTPGKVVQAKTVQNFTQGSPRYIEGSPLPPEIVTPQDYSAWVARSNGQARLSYGREVPMLAFIFNIQQLIAPSSDEGETHGTGQQAQRRKPRKFDESAGVLFDYLKGLDDLVVIADESHLYGVSAAAFRGALEELDPAACIGLTASIQPDDHVIFTYPLYRAIKDQYVKAPVLAFRKEGYGDDLASEEQQLRDAAQLRTIKQQAYDAYAEQVGAKHLNAVLFVVCSDTDHASQVAELLRTPRYFGSELAILQVDSKHEDEVTQRLLENLDTPTSKVLAVVSVNKLKEGWDVKNIAVVVTLRAMASEVLTQQTMGRGLRLPFGKYTGVLQIDQLDIISHQSFQDLLAAENVLVQFGLEEAVQDAAAAGEAIKDAVAQSQPGEGAATGAGAGADAGGQAAGGVTGDSAGAAGTNASSGPSDAGATGSGTTGGEPGGQPFVSSDATSGNGTGTAIQGSLFGGIGFRIIEGADERPAPSCENVGRTPAFADVSYSFPRTRITLQERAVDLSEIDESKIKAAAERVTSTGDVMVRKQIVAALGESGKKIRAVDTESAEVDSIPIEQDAVELALLRLVMNNQMVPANEKTKRVAKGYVVKKFMAYAPVEHWTVKALASADLELGQLVKGFVNSILRSRTERTEIDPLAMPCYDTLSVPLGDTVRERVDSRIEFERGRFYGGWMKSLFAAESFDSYTGEYLLAKLLDTSPNIVWWQRLHTTDGAFIYYNPKDRYFPDFVAMDDQGTHWIIEGKEQRGQTDDAVQKKRKAAEDVVHRLIGEDAFAGQVWGYLIAYEDDIKGSDSWNDLKAKAQPVSNA